MKRSPVRKALDPLAEYLRDETAGGVVLLVATAIALIWVNSPIGDSYGDLWQTELTLGLGDLSITEDLQHWVNDGLMVLFFFVVGLEIKRELTVGELRDRRTALLPAVAAVGGVALPALLFVLITAGSGQSDGWAIPAATDIAFAVGVMALLGDRVPSGAKLFLLTIAIVDDILAIAIIAVFYSSDIELAWLAGAVAGLLAVVAMRALGVRWIAAYVPVGLAIWVAMLESGVHPTIAGVALGLLTPARPVAGRQVLEIVEDRLHPLSAFVVVPLFALANAGVDFGGGVLADALESRLAWAIVAGLVIGKLLGIAGATLLGLRLGWGRLPDGVERAQVWGIAAVGGIGFTVSLFIAQLAYDDPAVIDIGEDRRAVRLGDQRGGRRAAAQPAGASGTGTGVWSGADGSARAGRLTRVSEFRGWPPEAIEFLRELEANNDRDWFKANRARYDEQVVAPTTALGEDLSDLGRPHTFRPWNDTRFHQAPPIKEHVGLAVGYEGAGGYYVELSLDGVLVAAGLHNPAPIRSTAIAARSMPDPRPPR